MNDKYKHLSQKLDLRSSNKHVALKKHETLTKILPIHV